VLERARTDVAARRLVDSGRLAEPFWYVDSPLTTPDPSRPFEGRPEPGSVPTPAPGVLLPDCPVEVGGRPVRLRSLLRQGVTLLLGADVEPPVIDVAAPMAVHRAADLQAGLPALIDLRPDEVWVVRPDAHVAAALRSCDEGGLRAALRRLYLRPSGASAR
jgi:hypothetical protein